MGWNSNLMYYVFIRRLSEDAERVTRKKAIFQKRQRL